MKFNYGLAQPHSGGSYEAQLKTFCIGNKYYLNNILCNQFTNGKVSTLLTIEAYLFNRRIVVYSKIHVFDNIDIKAAREQICLMALTDFFGSVTGVNEQQQPVTPPLLHDIFQMHQQHQRIAPRFVQPHVQIRPVHFPFDMGHQPSHFFNLFPHMPPPSSSSSSSSHQVDEDGSTDVRVKEVIEDDSISKELE